MLYAGAGKNGVTLFGVGELGMANTTPAAAIVSTITGRAPEEVVGIGANLPTDKLANKIDVVRRAITLNQPNPQDGVDVLAKVGGFDLVGMAGVMLGAASCGLPVLLDGFLLMLPRSQPARCLLQSNRISFLLTCRQKEKGARIALSHLGLEPYLNMEMRLGEGVAQLWRCPSSKLPVRYITTWANLLPVILFYRGIRLLI